MIDQKQKDSPENKQEISERAPIDQQPSKQTGNRRKQSSRKSKRRGRKRANQQMSNYIDSKMCEYCKGQQNEEMLLLCDRCDDSYHAYCLYPPLKSLPDKEWICQICIKQLKQLQEKKQKQRASLIVESDCYLCKKPLEEPPSMKGHYPTGKPTQIVLKTFNNIKCLYCRHTFHNPCFSQRKCSLNCWNCQKYIRKNGPKCHDDFMKWIEDSVKSIKCSNQCKFAPIKNLQDYNENIQRHRYFRLKVPSYMTTWQSIAQNEASIYYSFKTKGLTFIDDQLYEKENYELMMSMNNPEKDINGPILRLHKNDESTYDQFKINSEKGYVGPFEVKQDRIKGFYLIASEFIEPLTIVSEYLGEVKTARVALNFQENDSIFLLVRSSRSQQSLDIVPQLYGNISRFFLGINNEYKRIHGAPKLQNVKSLRFSYKGRVRLLLYTSKPIQAGETLYFNYNGSAFHEYPTQHFVA